MIPEISCSTNNYPILYDLDSTCKLSPRAHIPQYFYNVCVRWENTRIQEVRQEGEFLIRRIGLLCKLCWHVFVYDYKIVLHYKLLYNTFSDVFNMVWLRNKKTPDDISHLHVSDAGRLPTPVSKKKRKKKKGAKFSIFTRINFDALNWIAIKYKEKERRRSWVVSLLDVNISRSSHVLHIIYQSLPWRRILELLFSWLELWLMMKDSRNIHISKTWV